MCPFCERIKAKEYDETLVPSIVSFEPLNPVTPGHRLFVPVLHVPNARVGVREAALAMQAATLYMGYYDIDSANLITSVGAPATQTVQHLHLHLVPRTEEDGLLLPWSNQNKI